MSVKITTVILVYSGMCSAGTVSAPHGSSQKEPRAMFHAMLMKQFIDVLEKWL